VRLVLEGPAHGNNADAASWHDHRQAEKGDASTKAEGRKADDCAHKCRDCAADTGTNTCANKPAATPSDCGDAELHSGLQPMHPTGS
jgi:hypothetical protein